MTRRRLAILLIALSGSIADASPSEKERYAQALGNIVVDAIQPELAKHPELLSGTAKFSFHLDAQGHQSRIVVSSSTHNRFIEQTITRRLRALKFKPVPPSVLAEYPGKFVDFESQWSFAGPH